MHLSPADITSPPSARRNALGWLCLIVPVVTVLLSPRPDSVKPEEWRLLAIFAGTVAGMIFQPLPCGAIVLLGVLSSALTGALPIKTALGGYADPIVWLVLAAFFISRGMIRTGLGRRIAFHFIRAIGRHSLGLGYALVFTDMLLGMVIPSNAARSGGVVFPVTRSLAEAYDSHPGPSARRLGAFLMTLVFQGDIIVCAMFLTGQASNGLIAKFAAQTAGFEISYTRWMIGAALPGLVSLAVVPCLIFWLFPPEIRHTPAAAEFARRELQAMGRVTRNEAWMIGVFLGVGSLWIFSTWHGMHSATVALAGIGVLLVVGVLDWNDLMGDRAAWDVFIWYGGMVKLAEALGETSIPRLFAEATGRATAGWSWPAALLGLLLVYFFAHYAFASITAHASSMYIPFVLVTLAAGAPPAVAALSFAYLSNLDAALTHYGSTPAPIYFGAGYVTQRTWWGIGLAVAVANLLIWLTLGPIWWKLLGWW